MNATVNRLRYRMSLCLTSTVVLLGGAASIGHAAGVPGEPARQGNVEVTYRDPTKFTEMQRYPGERADWLDDLSRHVANRASRVLPAGERLAVTITDVQLAGQLEPWRPGNLGDTRIVRDTTPPRIALTFRLESAQGALVAQGERELRDINFMTSTSAYHRGQPLSYEKTLIDDWLRKEFGPSRR